MSHQKKKLTRFGGEQRHTKQKQAKQTDLVREGKGKGGSLVRDAQASRSKARSPAPIASCSISFRHVSIVLLTASDATHRRDGRTLTSITAPGPCRSNRSMYFTHVASARKRSALPNTIITSCARDSATFARCGCFRNPIPCRMSLPMCSAPRAFRTVDTSTARASRPWNISTVLTLIGASSFPRAFTSICVGYSLWNRWCRICRIFCTCFWYGDSTTMSDARSPWLRISVSAVLTATCASRGLHHDGESASRCSGHEWCTNSADRPPVARTRASGTAPDSSVTSGIPARSTLPGRPPHASSLSSYTAFTMSTIASVER
mmetsp:Transcript_68319/g.79536  ORF Transcript_68319/g.79536 Transcript_68319/m.79536 type:complete len:319 (-) Transcript_68319:900-1856(-)